MSEISSLVRKNKSVLLWPNFAAKLLGVSATRLYAMSQSGYYCIVPHTSDSGRVYYYLSDIFDIRKKRLSDSKKKVNGDRLLNITDEKFVAILKVAFENPSFKIYKDVQGEENG